MKFSVISARDYKWGIGKNGKIPWHIPEDFKWFKEVTAGATCFMGRATYEEIATIMKGKKQLLPGRKCVVITSRPLEDERVTVCNDIETYKDHATDNNFFIGGAGIYSFGLKVSDTAYITAVPGDYECDTFFPKKELSGFKLGYIIPLTDEIVVGEYIRKY